jgi:putative transposase
MAGAAVREGTTNLAMAHLMADITHTVSVEAQRSSLATAPNIRPAQPQWVQHDIIRLKALLPEAGCRTIAHHFNRRWAARRGMTVSKTYVADTCRKHQYQILTARRKLKHRVPRPMPRNRVWGCDLLVKTDRQGQPHLALAILDHASRACLRLQRLPDKSSWTLMQELVHAVKHYGRPQFLRTDNEAVLVSHLFRFGLWLLGIRQQRIKPGWPRSLSDMTFVARRRRCDQMQGRRPETTGGVFTGIH